MIEGTLRNGHRHWVPDNRWDLRLETVDAWGPMSPAAVVIPYFEQPASLRRMYAALAAGPGSAIEVIVVDDGSSTSPPPPPADFPFPARVLRQADRGCRPGAARNLGVASTDAEVLVFLDADTLPVPGAIDRLRAWPDVVPDALAVGRRRHADLTGWGPDETRRWLDGATDRTPPLRDDPAWLADGYRLSRDLLDVDDRSYRFVISAVMACHRSLYEDVGGFDGARDEYGGEDWEFAYRAFNNGAVLVHVPDAVAWHDEPDWASRDGRLEVSNAQTMWLAAQIPEPRTRGPGVLHDVTDVIVRAAPWTGAGVAETVVALTDVLEALGDVAIHVGGSLPPRATDHFRDDPRIRTGPPSDDALGRARVVIDLWAPVRWDPGGLRDVVEMVRPGRGGRVDVRDGREVVATIMSSRAIGRTRRAARWGLDPHAVLAVLFGTCDLTTDQVGARLLPADAPIRLAAEFGGWSGLRPRDGTGVAAD